MAMIVNTGPNSARRQSAPVNSENFSPLVKLPTLIIIYQVVGQRLPRTRAAPSSEDTGTIMPENWIVGIIDSTAAAKAAVIWVVATVEINNPQPVAASA